MRSYDRNGIDIGAVEQCLVVANEIEFLLRSESRGHRRADIATCHDFEARATCKTNRNLLPPPAQSYDRNSDHCLPPVWTSPDCVWLLIGYFCFRVASTM